MLRMCGAITSLPNTPPRRGAQLKKAQGQLYILPFFYRTKCKDPISGGANIAPTSNIRTAAMLLMMVGS
jgi:hypothetical protein